MEAVSRFYGTVTFLPTCTLKTYGTVKFHLYTFLPSAPDGDEWSASRSSSFSPRKEPRRTFWIWDWEGNRVDMDVWEKGQIPCLYWAPTHNLLGVQPVPYCLCRLS